VPQSKKNQDTLRDLLGGYVKDCLEEMCFEMSFRCGKGMSQLVLSRKFQTVGAHTQKAQELNTSFVRTAVRRLAEVERRSMVAKANTVECSS